MQRLTTVRESRRARGLSVRVKLALSYAAFLSVAGIAMLAVGFLLLRFVPEGNLRLVDGGWVPNRSNLVEVFVRYAGWAIAALVLFGLVGGWILAGIVLRPLQRITHIAGKTRDGSLDHRIALPGRRDELTDLADAFDTMLDRVQRTLDEERRFAANASHQLRTPHAIVRTMVEVAQADPSGVDVQQLLRRIGETNDRAIDITESLLALAKIGRGGSLEREAVDLSELVGQAIDDARAEAIAAEVEMSAELESQPVRGNRILLGQLAGNLVRNAVVHNRPGGRVSVTTSNSGSEAALTVVNTGAVVDPAVVATLSEPFVRGAPRTSGAGGHEGAGLGLAIVAAIADAHDGALELRARPEGGLHVRVTLPR